MAISFGDATGNLMNRLGKLGAALANAKSNQNTQLTAFTNVTTGIVGQFNAESDIQAQMGFAYIGQLNSIGSTVGSLMQILATLTVNRVVYRDQPIFNQTLTQQDIIGSLKEIILQMNQQGATVLEMTVSATPVVVNGQPGPNFVGAGNGILVASVVRPIDGLRWQNIFAEFVTFACTADSYTGGATEGNETFQGTGEGSTGVFNFDWPLGSNCNVTVNAIDSETSNGSGNLLTNSGFTDWTSNVPDNWTLVTGTAGTNITKEQVIVYHNGGASAKITGDAGGTLTQITQEFNTTTGTQGELEALTQYAFNIFARRDGTAAAAGVLTIDLIDGNSPANVIRDEAETLNTTTIDLTALTTGWTAYNVSFRMPRVLPSTMKIRMRLTTALTNGRSVYLDSAALGEITQLYTSGWSAALFSGSIPFQEDDYGQIQAANSRGAAGTLSTFQVAAYQLLPDLAQNELQLPYSATPTISDSNLIA